MKTILRAVALLAMTTTFPAWGQIWDTTGNRLLTGTFYIRDVIYLGNAGGTVSRRAMTYGPLVFSGGGTYSGTVTTIDSGAGSGTYNTSGSYSLSAGGHGFMTNPYQTSTVTHFVFSDGVLLGSGTEGGLQEIMIAVQATPQPTALTLNGTYSMAYLSDLQGDSTNSYNSMAQFTANGTGGIGSVPIKTYVGYQTTALNHTENGVTYTLVNGVGTLKFPTTSQIPIQGNKVFFIKPDGNFFFGGSASGFDMFVGVKRATGTAPALNGLFFQAGLNQSPTTTTTVGSFDTFYGAFKAVNGKIYDHQRYLSTSQTNPIDYTAIGFYPNNPLNDYTDDLSAVEYVVGKDGTFRIGIGQAPYMSIRIATQGPTFSAPNSGPYIDPTGVINSASYAPFTAGIARGELLAIFGANLSSTTQSAQGGQVFPKTMGGVQVLMNNVQAAIYYVSPGVVSAIVPYGITDSVIQIQIIRDAAVSNVVTAFRHLTAPGIFALDQSGSGPGAILDTNYAIVNQNNPTRAGAALQIFGTGLGDVFPVIQDGGLGPGANGTTPATTTAQIGVDIDFLVAQVLYSGLTPTVAGLYQVNAVVPSGVSTGDVFVDIATPDAYHSQVNTRVTSGAAAPVAVKNALGERLIPRRR